MVATDGGYAMMVAVVAVGGCVTMAAAVVAAVVVGCVRKLGLMR